MSKAISKVWVFASSSRSGKYQTLLYTDGSRSCRHTRAVDVGTANSEAESFHDYTQQQTTSHQQPATNKVSYGTKSKKGTEPAPLYRRKFVFDK